MRARVPFRAAPLLVLPALPLLTRAAIPPGTSLILQPFTTVPSNFGPPQDLVSANDNTGRLFITTRNGDILLSDSTGHLNTTTPFLNLTAAGVPLNTSGEGGFAGLAFSPNFSAPSTTPGSGKFYTFTTENFSTSTPADYSQSEMLPNGTLTPNNQTVIREWSVDPNNPSLALTTSRVLLRVNHPQSNHQGGGLKFGPDGDLYLSIGDGGGGNDNNGGRTAVDGHTNNLGNAQDLAVPMGKILRIDPRGNNSTNGQYGIPADNPFVNQSGKLPEIYAYGLRNPYRFSFDSLTGKLYAGDVGQNNREEVDIIQSGGNYGWVFREGTRDNSGDYGTTPPPGFSPLDPIAEYTHADGNAIQGGFVYRGPLAPNLDGLYIFGDYQGTTGKGRLFYTDAAGGPVSEFTFLPGNPTPPSGLFGFGQDQSNNLYTLFDNGQILQLVPEPTLLLPALLPLLLLTRQRQRSLP